MPPEYYSNLVIVAAISTFSIVSLSILFRNFPIFINFIFITIIPIAIFTYSWLLNVSNFSIVFEILARILIGDLNRSLLICFWIFNVSISIVFCFYVRNVGNSTTIHRKFFHLTVSLIYITGLLYDPQFTWLCAWLLLDIFILIETLRYLDVRPWSPYLNEYLLIFKDSQDSEILMTPIYLLIGIFLPLFLNFLRVPSNSTFHCELSHFAGVASVGVGDSFAAIIGSKIGKTKWKGSNKSLEGTVSMIISMLIFLLIVNIFIINQFSIFPIIFCSILAGLFEAFISKMDNLILPFITWIIL